MVKCEECGKDFKNERGLKIHKSCKHATKKNEDVKDEKKVQICPSCGSPRIGYASLDTKSVKTIIGLGLPSKYACKDCGYEGLVKLEVPASEAGKIKPKKTKETKKKEEPFVLKPIFTVVIVCFLVAVAFLTLRGPEATGFLEDLTGAPAYTDEALNFTEEQKLEFETPENITGVEDVARATGIQDTTGFLLPLFLIFFIVGLVVYMLWFHIVRIGKY